MPGRIARLRVGDVLPALINGIRAFLTIGAAALVWIVTAWPGGTTFVVFAAVGITLFAPMGITAYGAARSFTLGTAFAAVGAAVAAFALLPQQPTFLGFCGVLGLWLVPVGALAAQPWQQGFFFALQANFVPLLGPANPMTYDPVQFYNSAVALLSGIGFAMLGLRLLPPMSQTMRDRRLLALTLHDLRRLACGRSSLTGQRGIREILAGCPQCKAKRTYCQPRSLQRDCRLAAKSSACAVLRTASDWPPNLPEQWRRSRAATAPRRSANSTVSIRHLPICRSQAPRHDIGCEDGG
ncbi:MAG: FUSC family protein [Acetobacteraceae bacterium]